MDTSSIVTSITGKLDSPEALLEFLKDFKHNFRYSTNLSSVNFDYVVYKYFVGGSLPSFTFSPLSSFLSSREGSCYDLSLFSSRVLLGLGYKCDILHFGWTPRGSSSLDILSCMHTVCRFWSGSSWFTIHGFLYKDGVRLLGPFYSLEDFLLTFTSLLRESTRRGFVNVTFVDSLRFNGKELPASLVRIFPQVEEERALTYWII